MKNRNTKTVDAVRELYFSEIKKAILEIVDALLNMQKIKDRNIKFVSGIDTS